MAVAAGSIVERLDIIEDIGSGDIARFVDAFSDALLLQAAEEGFRDGIVQQLARLLMLGSRLWA